MKIAQPAKAERQSTIAKRFIVYVVVFSSVITLIITAIQLYIDYTKDLQGINERLNQIKRVHADALATSLWTADTDTLSIQLEGILRMPEMEFLEVKEGERVWGVAGSLISNNIISQQYPLNYVSKGKARNLGVLRVVATLDGVYGRLFSRAMSILVSNVIKTALVAGFIIFIFNQLLTRHLAKIASFAQTHKIENSKVELLQLERDVKKANKDELDVLVDCINQMQNNIANAYQKIKENEAKYRQLVELAQEGIWQVDTQAITTYVNPAMAKLLGYTVDEMQARSIYEFVGHCDKVLIKQHLQGKSCGGQLDVEFERKDGKPIYTTLVATAIVNEAGEYLGAIAGAMDITQRKQAEDALHEHRMKLEELVQNRTKALEVSNRELESFSYSVAHDLRTPLRSIVSFSQILQEDVFHKLTHDEQDAVQRIIKAGKNMSGLIDDILELSRISRATMDYQTVDVSAMVEEIAGEIAAQYKQNIKFIVGNNLVIDADPILLRVLLQNLIDNACKFSSGAMQEACVEIGQAQMAGRRWLYVKDNGVGFDANYAHKLFYAFQRLHSEDEFTGTGVGLATVQRIVERHGGEVWADSEQGKGAIFYFSLQPDKKAGVVGLAHVD